MRLTLPATEWELGRDGAWPGLDTRTSADATGGARVLTGLRRDEGRLRPIEAPSLMAVDGSGDIRAIFYHRRGDVEPAIRLTVSGAKLYADGVEQKTFDGGNLTLSEGGAVVMDQGGNRTLILDGGADSPAYLFDETLDDPNRVIPLTLPATPGGMTPSVSEIVETRLDTGNGSLTQEDEGPLPSGWTVTDMALIDSVHYQEDAWSVPTWRLNTKGADPEQENPRITYDMGAPADWSGYNSLTLLAWSGGNENTTGYLVDFIFSEDGDSWHRLAVNFEAARKELAVTLPLANIPSADRKAVRYWGFEWLNTQKCVVSFKSLSSTGGTTGPREYVRTRHRVAGSGADTMDLQSIEGPLDENGKATVSVDAGTNGAQVTLSFDDGAVPEGHVDKIWRRDTGNVQLALFHYVGDADAGESSFTDAVFDVSANVTLKQGRAAPVTGATCGAFSRSRLHLYKGGVDRVSAVGQPSVFNDARPEDVTQSMALGAMGPEDGLTLRIGEIGNVLAMAKFGLDLADQYTSSLLLMTADGTDALFQGDSPETMNIHRRQPGGIRSAHAWCHDSAGNVVSVDPNGDVVVRDRNLSSKVLSGPIQEDLRNAPVGDWTMARDGLHGRIVLFAHKPYVWDGSGWLNLDQATVGTVTAASMRPSGDGGHAVFAGGNGLLFRLFDSASPRVGGVFETAEWNRLPEEWRAERIWGDVEGGVTATLRADGEAVAVCRFGTRETAVRRHKARRFVVRLTVGADGAVHRVRTRLTPWRR